MLSDTEILEGMEKGYIIINPYNEEQLNPNSYDVRLGQHIWVQKRGNIIFNREQPETEFNLIKVKDGQGFNFQPGEFYLAHTEEFIGSLDKCAPHLMTKSSPARCGLQVHLSAGFGDVGFANRWALEIVNLGKKPVRVYPGERIAQVAWTHTGPVRRPYQGRYVQGDSEWSPENLLPRWNRK